MNIHVEKEESLFHLYIQISFLIFFFYFSFLLKFNKLAWVRPNGWDIVLKQLFKWNHLASGTNEKHTAIYNRNICFFSIPIQHPFSPTMLSSIVILMAFIAAFPLFCLFTANDMTVSVLHLEQIFTKLRT